MNAVIGAATAFFVPVRSTDTERLPFRVELGPYRLDVELREPSLMSDRRRRSCINIEEQRIELRRDQHGLRLAEAFLHALIRLSHFSKGCQQGCVEEAYTHSFATGMVEFAQRNVRAWRWFNLLLAEHLPASACYDRVVWGAVPVAPAMPDAVRVAGRAVPVRTLTRTQTGNAFGWYDFDRREVQLYDGLNGANVAIVALHEITHALHHAHGLRVRDRERNFLRVQLKGWLEIMMRDHAAWRWLAWSMSHPGKACVG